MSKTKQLLARNELVLFLENVLAQIREEKLTIQEAVINLPAEAVVELEVENKEGDTKVELEIKWRLSAGIGDSDKKTGETGKEEQVPATEDNVSG
ncbi:MAG: amphi-Trp domain-containing protein [Bacillota bacterium]